MFQEPAGERKLVLWEIMDRQSIRNALPSVFWLEVRCSMPFWFGAVAVICKACNTFRYSLNFHFLQSLLQEPPFFVLFCFVYFFWQQHTLLDLLAAVLLLWEIGLSNCFMICSSLCFEQHFFLSAPFSHSVLVSTLYSLNIIDRILQSRPIR